MKLSDQYCTRIQGDRLTELGITGANYYRHVNVAGPVLYEKVKDDNTWREVGVSTTEVDVMLKDYMTPVFSVAELGVALPHELLNASSIQSRADHKKSEEYVGIYKYKYLWSIRTQEGAKTLEFHTEAQARAAILIFLLENKLLTADEANKQLAV